MKTKTLLLRIADLLLISDEASKDWVNVPRIRRSWYAFCVLWCLYLVTIIFRNGLLTDVLNSSESVTFYYRLLLFLIFLALQTVMIIMTITFLNMFWKKGVL
jgi:hypothetical protein